MNDLDNITVLDDITNANMLYTTKLRDIIYDRELGKDYKFDCTKNRDEIKRKTRRLYYFKETVEFEIIKNKLIEYFKTDNEELNKKNEEKIISSLSKVIINKYISGEELKEGVTGTFESYIGITLRKNNVLLKKGFITEKNPLYHELIHAISYLEKEFNYKNNKRTIEYNGLRRTCFDKSFNSVHDIGVGITEGLTELFNQECFEANKKVVKKIYPTYVRMVKKISKVIGVDKLKEYYMTNNLVGLMYDLSNKTGLSKKDIYKFIIGMDLMKYDGTYKLDPKVKTIYKKIKLKTK